MKKTVSFLASGRGSNFTVVAECILRGEIDAKPGVLVSDRKDAKALEKAREFGMEAFFVNPREYPSKQEHEMEMASIFQRAGTDLIVAAGYMRILSSFFVNEYRNRIINIHPALLPAFPGVDAQKQAFDYGVRVTGCTTHFIDEGTDTGPVILQAPVEVLPDDTIESLSRRILAEEHRILPESVRLFCSGRIKIKGRKVIIT